MIGHAPTLFLAQHPVLFLDAGHDTLDRDGEVVERHFLRVAPGRRDGRLVDQIGEVGAGETGGEARDLVQIDIRTNTDLANMHLENGLPTAAVGAIDQHLPVETSGAQQRRVEDFGTIGCRQQNDAGARIETVEFGQQLVQRLLLFVIAAEGAGGSGCGRAHRVHR
jgi:hypothetical protein